MLGLELGFRFFDIWGLFFNDNIGYSSRRSESSIVCFAILIEMIRNKVRFFF